MSDSSKKQTFLHGAALLAIATAVVKIIGALYKIPLKMVIGDQGYGYFMTAYDIYSVLLMISTTGLPIAMSRMISQSTSLGRYNQVRRVYKVSWIAFLILGVGGTLLMMVFSRQLAAFQNQPDAWMSILCLGPCALFMCVMSAYRGFFQGQSNMRPTSNSQMLEAVIKLVVGLVIAFVVMRYTNSIPMAAGGAILGVTVSCLVSMLYLYGKFRPEYRDMPKTEEKPDSHRVIAKNLLAIAVPITIGSAGLQILTVLETRLYMGQLLTVGGHSQEAADIIRGIYAMTQTFFNMPCAFIIPITTSVIPAVTAQLTLKDDKGVRGTEESAARVAGLISLPCAVGLCLVAEPVMSLLYSGSDLELAGKLMALLAVCIFPYGVIQFTNSILQSHGFAHVPVINMLLVGALKLAVVYVLVGNPTLGILGAPLGAILCYSLICLLNLLAIRRLVPQKPALLKNLLRPLLSAAVMGVAVWLCRWGLEKLMGADISRIIWCGAPVAVGVAVYFVCVVLFKAITREDCQLLPKGDKIAKLLKL